MILRNAFAVVAPAVSLGLAGCANQGGAANPPASETASVADIVAAVPKSDDPRWMGKDLSASGYLLAIDDNFPLYDDDIGMVALVADPGNLNLLDSFEARCSLTADSQATWDKINERPVYSVVPLGAPLTVSGHVDKVSTLGPGAIWLKNCRIVSGVD